jgi:hypothetical protein
MPLTVMHILVAQIMVRCSDLCICFSCVLLCSVFHVKEDGWVFLGAEDTGMDLHYKYADEHANA